MLSDSIDDDVPLGFDGDTVKMATAKFFQEKIKNFNFSSCLPSSWALKACFHKRYNRSFLFIRCFQQSDVWCQRSTSRYHILAALTYKRVHQCSHLAVRNSYRPCVQRNEAATGFDFWSFFTFLESWPKVCISGPADYNYEESVSTLRYANRAKSIKNKPRINEDPKDVILCEFQEEIARWST